MYSVHTYVRVQRVTVIMRVQCTVYSTVYSVQYSVQCTVHCTLYSARRKSVHVGNSPMGQSWALAVFFNLFNNEK